MSLSQPCVEAHHIPNIKAIQSKPNRVIAANFIIAQTDRSPSCTPSRYYDCEIQEVTANGYKVLFPAYGNVEEVPLEYLQKKVAVAQAKVGTEIDDDHLARE